MTRDCDPVPNWAESPSPLESAYYYYGLAAALQARTVPQGRVQPKDCSEPYHEDLLAPWPRENHYDLRRLSLENVKLGIIKQLCEVRQEPITDTRPCRVYDPREEYEQKYLPLAQIGQEASLSEIWCRSAQSQTGLITDLVRAVSEVPVLKLLLARIQMGTFKNAPTKTVVLIEMALDDWLPQKKSLQLAYACKAVLVRHGISDIEVEVRALPPESLQANASLGSASRDSAAEAESGHDLTSNSQPAEVLRLLKQKRLECFQELEAKKEHLSEAIKSIAEEALENSYFGPVLRDVDTMGLRISTSHTQGTMGPILRLLEDGQHRERILGLASFNVVQRPTWDSGDWPPLSTTFLQSSQDQGKPSRDMQLGDIHDLDCLRKSCYGGIEETPSLIELVINRRVQKLQKMLVDKLPEDEQDRLEKDLEQTEQQRSLQRKLEELLDAIPTTCLRLGSVFAAGAYGTIVDIPTSSSPDKHGHGLIRYLPNWALIDIDPSYFATQAQAQLNASPASSWLAWKNRLRLKYAGVLASHWLYGAMDDPQHCYRTRIRDPESKRCYYHVGGISKSFKPHVPQAVFKQGASTGFTKGETLGALAIVPRPSPDGSDGAIWATEIVVVMKNNYSFSKDGDSGAALIDADCRVIGMLTNGIVPTDLPKATHSQQKQTTIQASDTESSAEESGEKEESDTEDIELTRRNVEARDWFDKKIAGLGLEEPEAVQAVEEEPIETFAEDWPEDPKEWLQGELRRCKNQDLTFATPIELILEDIYNVTGQRAEVA